jgi:hypothetical protein
MSDGAWARLVNSDGSDEFLELCNAALLEIQKETLARARKQSICPYSEDEWAHPEWNED